MNVGNVYVGIKGDTTPLQGSLAKAKGMAVASAKASANAYGRLRDKLLSVETAALAAGAAFVGWQVGQGFVQTAAEFEKMEVQLTTIMGTSAKAKESMAWISEFGTKTPYEINEVTAAFVKLQAYGMDGTQWMGTLGDTASSMGKGLMDAVEMFADAASGEFERLKEFGVKAKTEGDKVAFSWSQNGKDMVVNADKTQSGITEALGQIFQRFDGGMAKQSATFSGMLSNMSDHWTQFKKLVMESGPFDYMKAGLRLVLDEIDRIKSDDGLAQWAATTGQFVVNSFKNIATGAKWVAKSFLGWKLIWAGLVQAWNVASGVILKGVAFLAQKVSGIIETLVSAESFFGMDTSAEQALADKINKFAEGVNNRADVQFAAISTAGIDEALGQIDSLDNAWNVVAKKITMTVAKIRQAGTGETNTPASSTSSTSPAAATATQGAATAITYYNQALDETADKLTKVQTISETVAGRLENGFSSAFRGMMEGVTDFGDMAKAILMDIAEEIMRVMVFEQLAKSISTGVSGYFSTPAFNSSASAATGNYGPMPPGRAVGGPVSAGQTYLVGEQGPELLHMGSSSGNITPNHKLGNNSTPTIHQTINIDARGAEQGVESRIQQAVKDGANQGYQMMLKDFGTRGPGYGLAKR